MAIERLSWALAGLLLGCSCRHATDHSAQEAHAPDGPPAAGQQQAQVPPPKRKAPDPVSDRESSRSTDPRQERMALDLARHLERSELRQGAALVVDLGVPGGRKYDFGGWLSGAGEHRDFNATSALMARDKRLKLALPAVGPGATHLALRARTFSRGPLTVHINGKRVSDLRMSGSDFEVLHVDIPEGVLRPGENELSLRAHRSGRAPGGGRAALALDWLRVAPAGAATEAMSAAPPSPSALAQGGEQGSLQLPVGYRLGYTIEVPPGARLRARVSAVSEAGACRLAVVAHLDGRAPVTLSETEVGPQQTPLDIDLAPLAGSLARLDLIAGGMDVRLVEPRVVTLVTPKERSEPTAPKNVVIILIDTLRADKLAPYNDKTRVRTPGLRTFVKNAAVLRNARAQENWTKPSVATLLSSLFPWEHNATKGDSRVPSSVELLPEVLKKRGYYTGSFIANGYVSDKFGFKQGWHTYRNYIREGRRAKAQYVAADVLDWLDGRPKDKPFFLYMHTIDPHVPYRPPDHFLSMYDQDKGYRGPVDFRASSTLLEKIKLGKIKLRARDRERLEALYDAEISYHDVHFAAVLEGLHKRGLEDNTIVVVTSDHGEEFWDHGSVGHGHSVYDELLRVPLVVRIPGITHGGMRIDDAVGLVDVMPTVLDALGQELPPERSGRSLLPLLQGKSESAPRTSVAGFMRGWRTLSVGKLKLVQRTLNRFWLYNTQTDPGEQRDLKPDRPIALRYARGLLGLSLADSHVPTGRRPLSSHRSKRPRGRHHRRQDVHIDRQTAAQLEALGYVDN